VPETLAVFNHIEAVAVWLTANFQLRPAQEVK
jgi:hypothetical protein